MTANDQSKRKKEKKKKMSSSQLQRYKGNISPVDDQQ